MAFLTSSELFTYVDEAGGPGIFVPAVATTNVDVRVRELSWTNEVEKDDEASKYMTGFFFGSDESIIGKKTINAGYNIKLAPGEYDSTATTGKHKLNYKGLFENCSMASLGVATDDLDLAPGLWAFWPDQSKAENTMSIARVVYDSESGKYQIFQGSGAMSNFTINCDGVAAPFTAAFETMAAAQDVIEATTAAKLDPTKVMRTVGDSLRNTTVKVTDLSDLSSQEFCISTIAMESGNELNQVECQTSDSGLSHYMVTNVNPTITINPLLKTLTDFDWWTALSNERMYKLEITSKFVEIYVPRCQMLNANVADSNGFLRNEITFRPLVNIDEDKPTWIPIGDFPAGTNYFAIPYYLGIKESAPNY
jgi:hypothetical protein